MNYGFLIDNRKCIGCHACSTACKSENEVPLGVNRTWVKYVEKGEFPDTRRYFQVTRCNHCAHPPCVPICPTKAMYQREDGIVEFDSDICIGCKACMQACPYDAVYIDPDSGTAAKCHFCAHRTDVGLEPACVVVCPVHAIIAGDIDDAGSEISRLLSTHEVSVRKPEQNTRPKLFYIEAEESAILPTAAAQDYGMLWAQPPGQGNGGSGQSDWRGPIQIAAGRMAGAMCRPASGADVPESRARRERPTTCPTASRGTGRCPRISSPRRSARARSSWPPPESLWGSCPPSRSLRRSLPSWRSSSSASPWDCWCGTWTARSGSGPS